MLITDNRTGKQTVHQAGPFGPNGDYGFPYALGRIGASTDDYGPKSTGFGQPFKRVAVFNTDASSSEVLRALNGFGASFNKQAIPYVLPDPRIPFLPRNKHPLFPTPNSNLYGGAAWEYLTGSPPELPDDIEAPGWGDHRLPNSPFK